MFARPWLALGVSFYLSVSAVAQQSTVGQSQIPLVLCVAGQCLQGFSNVSIGAKITSPNEPTPFQLLPGEYTSSTSPQTLHDLLASAASSLSASPGFDQSNLTSGSNNAPVLPLNLQLQPGLSIFTGKLYSGQAGFSALPTQPVGNNSAPLSGVGSLAVAQNIWAAISAGGSNANDRVVVWDSIPDFGQLPGNSLPPSASLELLDLQSAACSPACASGGVCSTSGTCTCPSNFQGSSCESCASGFFGPSCSPCPAGCTKCDDGIEGSGQCLGLIFQNQQDADSVPTKCNCVNGKCGANGQCQCNAGWQDGSDGTKCSTCKQGFFKTTTGDCQVCQLGCSQCSDQTGQCIVCAPKFSQDPVDKTKCDAPQTATSSGQVCPDGSFGDGAKCTPCASSCRTCTGPTSNDCVACSSGTFMLTVAAGATGGGGVGVCVSADGNGVCQGGLIADNIKSECDTCGAKCTSCKVPNFNVASTPDQVQCTGCLPGSVISNGNCVDSCPAGTVVSSQDNLTCVPCTSPCASCAGSPNFCLSCTGGQLAFEGKCISNTCPPGSFPFPASPATPNACHTCHADCATCTGSSFNQCTTCPPNRPVLSNGRCLPTCARNQFFSPGSGSNPVGQCQSCDSSCATCSGSGSGSCMSCPDGSGMVLRAGKCVTAQSTCPAAPSSSSSGSGTANGVVPGLGVCLTELILLPSSATNLPPLPTITGLTDPTNVQTVKRPLTWWEILLMALGCAFIFLVIIMLWRRRAKKQRKQRTKMFVEKKGLDRGQGMGWRWRLGRLFSRNNKTTGDAAASNKNKKDKSKERRLSQASRRSSTRPGVADGEYKMRNLGRDVEAGGGDWDEEEGRMEERDRDAESFFDKYDYSTKARSSMAPSSLPPLGGTSRSRQRSQRSDTRNQKPRFAETARVYQARDYDEDIDEDEEDYQTEHKVSRTSMYSEMTGIPRRGPEPRQPVKDVGAASITSTHVKLVRPGTGNSNGNGSGKGKNTNLLLNSRFSVSTIGSSRFPTGIPEGDLIDIPPVPTEAQAYALATRPDLATLGPLEPTHTGSTNKSGLSSRNPFRQHF
ncbi:hypothetical protein BDN72DRAFT_963270 [Pluteus cervinus]|uniref:Uncharacterized protein n=1 Tax=Pluteus cervinus TaxID=181527 RepID=A0ACD3AFM5_9AGAR|nr:hypothetical protein BDN72DRAFT_963270 [Pluteus cervinus]